LTHARNETLEEIFLRVISRDVEEVAAS
jgi:hypothetical protein